jgi:hypothetical protein
MHRPPGILLAQRLRLHRFDQSNNTKKRSMNMAGVGAVAAVGAGAGIGAAGPGPVGGVGAGAAAGRAGAAAPSPAAAEAASPSSVVKLSSAGMDASKGLGEVAHSGGGTYNAAGLSDALGLGGSSSPFSQSLTQSARSVGETGACSDQVNANGQSYAAMNSMDPAIVALLLMLAMQEKKKEEGAGVSIAVSIDIKV